MNDYINELLKTDTGTLTEGLQVDNLADFLIWVNSNCHYTGMVNEQAMREFAYGFTGINKIRYFWVNRQDFKEISMQSINAGEVAYNESKAIDDFVVIPDDLVKRGEFWFCTTDEWMILKYGDDI